MYSDVKVTVVSYLVNESRINVWALKCDNTVSVLHLITDLINMTNETTLLAWILVSIRFHAINQNPWCVPSNVGL